VGFSQGFPGVGGPFLPQGINKEHNMAAEFTERKSMTCAPQKSPADGNDKSRCYCRLIYCVENQKLV